MRQIRDLLAPVALVPILGLWAAPALGDPTSWVFLPTRVLEIEGGTVSFQSALIVDTRLQLTNPVFEKYPTRYILSATNEADFPVWIEAEWRVPGQKPFATSGEFKPKTFREFFVKVKDVAWNTPIPVGVSIYADGKKSRKLGGRDVALFFHEEDKEQFMQGAKEANRMSGKAGASFGRKVGMPLLSGFQEMDLSTRVAGTKADEKLAEDIKMLLWKSQSRRHWDCTHEVLGARQRDLSSEGLPAKAKQLVEEGRARGEVELEEWQVKSCNDVSTYLVLLGKSAGGGTDVSAVEMESP